jgi:hypothetical protein
MYAPSNFKNIFKPHNIQEINSTSVLKLCRIYAKRLNLTFFQL